MNVSLFHGSFEPLIYGVIIFLGIASIWWKITHRSWAAAALEITVFIIVFRLHGGTMNGGFAATIAALLAGLILPLFLRRRT